MAALTISTEEVKRLKGLGIINNKGTDNFSIRVPTVSGIVTSEQMIHLAKAAKEFGNGRVLFTTRLSVEIPGVPYDKIGAVTEFLAEVGFAPGGTGPRVRTIVSCKGTTCQYGLIDTFAVSKEIHERFYIGYHNVALPHKFKIGIGGCPNSCIKPSLNDLGVMGWRNGFKVFIGGRWGKKHTEGRALDKIIESQEELYNVIEKTILLFKEEGNAGERFADMIDRLGFSYVQDKILA